MERNHVLGMVCGYYLSRFDDVAYENLGYGTHQATHQALGTALNVPAESIKNWRDEFDPVHDNARQGWHKREMYPSRRRAIEALGDLAHDELLTLVTSIAAAPEGQTAEELLAAISDPDGLEGDAASTFCLRGLTGERAERAFMEFHARHAIPLPGQLIDRRYEQCGFDFEIVGDAARAFIEVKGLAGTNGGVTFTEKEWRTARDKGDSYFLVLVRNAASTSRIVLIPNPGQVLKAQMRIFTTVQVGWSVGQRALEAAEATKPI
ncbi:MAG: DUF3883 domain-containing protein [Phycisphaerales bacterium]